MIIGRGVIIFWDGPGHHPAPILAGPSAGARRPAPTGPRPNVRWSWTYNQTFNLLNSGEHTLKFRTFDGYEYSREGDVWFEVPERGGGLVPKNTPGPDALMVVLTLVVATMYIRRMKALRE